MNEILERYYTSDMVSSFLISMIPCKNPQVILDLGVGEASLTKAAFTKWERASFFGVDIDRLKIEENRKLFPFCKFINVDLLDKGFVNLLHLDITNVDIAICNPPYSKMPKICNIDLDYLIQAAKLFSLKNSRNLNTELLFLLYNLSILKSGGYLGIILPDGVFTNNSYTTLRADLLQNHTISHIIELPEKIFSKTEAKTHILILKKGILDKKIRHRISLFKLNVDGSKSPLIKVSEKSLIKRMDFKFHSGTMNNAGDTLESLKVEITRGTLSSTYLKRNNSLYFHTTDFKRSSSRKINLPISSKRIPNAKIAIKGDILIARVGKRIVGEWGYVESGECVVSDCILILRFPIEYVDRLLRYFESAQYLNDLALLKHGVCSQLISKTDLLNIKIP